MPDGTWRGVGPLVADAIGIDSGSGDYLNASFTGARMKCVLAEQLPQAVRLRPDVTLIVVGMNDTLRSDFDATRLAEDLDAVVTKLQDAGSSVLALRFHDHARVFRLPGPLARALRGRISELNGVIDLVAARRGFGRFDVGSVSGTYDLSSWSVDRLHPSEVGHRLLAAGFTELIADAGYAVPNPVSTACSGGLRTGAFDHVGWLVGQGVPWLWRRGKDFLPYAAAIIARSAARSAASKAEVVRGKVGALAGR